MTHRGAYSQVGGAAAELLGVGTGLPDLAAHEVAHLVVGVAELTAGREQHQALHAVARVLRRDEPAPCPHEYSLVSQSRLS